MHSYALKEMYPTSSVHEQNLVTGTYCLSGGLHREILLGYMRSDLGHPSYNCNEH